MSDTEAPLITISLVTYNGMRWLDACLASAVAQTYPAVEFIILDNGSTDETVGRLVAFARDHASVRLIQSPDNLGFAVAHNRNLELARGAYVCLLNQDVVLDGGFLQEAAGAFATDPGLAAVQGKLLRLGPALERRNAFDTTGLLMRRNRRVTSRGQDRDDNGEFDLPGSIFGADGPAPVFRVTALQDVREPKSGGGWEILDEDFFMYKEDVDLAWRLLLFGWNAAYVPTAVAWHARGAGASAESARALAHQRRMLPTWVKCLSWGNQRLMQVKNEQGKLFTRDVIPILWKELRALTFLAVFETRCLGAIPRLIRGLPAARMKRAYIMKHKRRSSKDMEGWFRDP